MKLDKTLTAKKLIVTACELNGDADNPQDRFYEFDALEFENGLILVESPTTNDWYFEDRDSIEPGGSATLSSVEETGETVEYPAKLLFQSIQGSMKEFGITSVPLKHIELWKK